MSNDPQQLTQSDFRKLLQHSSEQNASIISEGHHQHQQKQPVSGRRVLGGGRHLQRSQAAPHARPTEIVDETPVKKRFRGQTSHTTSDGKYRDRAAERRQGLHVSDKNNELVDNSGTVLLATETGENNVHGMSVAQRALYEKSKYLGGNVDNTHLVKGLDFLLLQKTRAALLQNSGGTVAESLDAELERLVDHKNDSASTVSIECRTQMGRNVLAVLEKSGKRDDGAVELNELFLPARMYYRLGSDAAAMTMRIRSQEEVAKMAAEGADVATRGFRDDNANDHLVITKVVAAIRMARQQQRNQEKVNMDGKGNRGKVTIEQSLESFTQESEAPVEQQEEEPEPFDSDDDIFADAGVDYQVTVEEVAQMAGPAPLPPANSISDGDPGEDPAMDKDMVTAPYPPSESDKDEDMAITAPYPPSESEMDEDMVTAPYPQNNSDSDEDMATAPYPASPSYANRPHTDDMSPSSSSGDEALDMRVIAEARARFRDETQGMLLYQDSRCVKNEARSDNNRGSRVSSGQLNKEWRQTRKIMKEKYGVDIKDDNPLPGTKEKKSAEKIESK
ncbi:hypothetical protein FB645_006146 [Coemansia sp. IMI 203386]|nr:hypothetical protein FB645_006146 [Coemansia sp. IMI 203386]